MLRNTPDMTSRDVPGGSYCWGYIPFNIQRTYVVANYVRWFKSRRAARAYARQSGNAFAVAKFEG